MEARRRIGIDPLELDCLQGRSPSALRPMLLGIVGGRYRHNHRLSSWTVKVEACRALLAGGSKDSTEACWDPLELDCLQGRSPSALRPMPIGIVGGRYWHNRPSSWTLNVEACRALLVVASGSKGACWDPLEVDPISESPRSLAIGTTADAHRDCGTAAT